MINQRWPDNCSSALCASSDRCQGGFSLLEVLVAFAILALTLGLLIQIFSRALTTTALSGEYSRAVTVADARLNSVGLEIPLEPGSYSGDLEDGFSWQVSIEPFAPDDVNWEPALDAYLVTVVTTWGSDIARQVRVSTLQLGGSSTQIDSNFGGVRTTPTFRKDDVDR